MYQNYTDHLTLQLLSDKRALNFGRMTATHQSQRGQDRYCISTSRLHTLSDQMQSTARRFNFLPDTLAKTRRGHCEACLSSCMSAIAFFESGSADCAPATHCTASLVHASLQSALDPAVTQIYKGKTNHTHVHCTPQLYSIQKLNCMPYRILHVVLNLNTQRSVKKAILEKNESQKLCLCFVEQ